ncbi:universal stress protein [Flavobacteriaceae bacterium F08102]|nr:universal stress protein [Flavobacteriaceae bacterium F08102]
MKSILLLTDFSDTSKNAIEYAIQLFKDKKCMYYVLYVQDSTRPITTVDLLTDSSTSIYKSLIKKHQKKLQEFVSTLRGTYESPNAIFKPKVDYDSLVDAVKQLIKSKNIDVVVMGSNGATGAKEVVFGSNTLNVIRKVECTTLIIPENYSYTTPKTILLPLDPVDTLSGNDFAEFLAFVKQHNLHVHVVRVYNEETDDEQAQRDQAHLERHLSSSTYVYHTLDNLSIDRAVSTYIQLHPIDMMSLFVQKENLLERLFLGSATTKINKQNQIPLFIIHS